MADLLPALFIVSRSNPSWSQVVENLITTIRVMAEAGIEFQVKATEILRTLDQNAAMWPALADFTRCVPLSVMQKNGSTRKATPYDWKDVLTAAFEEETEWVPGLRGGVVMLGARTSKYGKKKMGDFLKFVRAEGNERGVVWSEKAKENFDFYIPAKAA